MRVLVCGGRDYDDRDHIFNALTRLDGERGPFTCVIHGDATGADHEAMLWTQMMDKIKGRTITHAPFVADWHQYGNAAGPIRNTRMINEGKPDLVIAFPGSKGTKNMILQARNAGIEVIEIERRKS